jgi:CHASE2 domain-containing sensor protein
MGKNTPIVFVSYRRDDASGRAGRLSDWLKRQFGSDRIFLDTDKISAGAEFPKALEERLAASDVLLAVIGPQWSEVADARGRRLDQPDDFVRREISAALARGTRIIPVLVGGARMPAGSELPEPLRSIAERNAVRLEDASFERDFDFLVDEILERPRNFIRRQFDRGQRLAFVAKRSWWGLLLIVVLVLLFVWMKALDAFTLDTQIASYLMWAADAFTAPPAESPVTLVAIDQPTEDRLGRQFDAATAEQWRLDHARIVDQAAKSGAAAVVFDIAMEANHPAADAQLAESVRRAAQTGTRVVFGVNEVKEQAPVPVLADALRGVGTWGSLCIVRRLGYTFSSPLAVLGQPDKDQPEFRPARIPALALAAAHGGDPLRVDVERRTIEFSGSQPKPLIYYSGLERIRWSQGACRTLMVRDTVATLLIRPSPSDFWRKAPRRISYADALDGQGVPDLRGKILLVGVVDHVAERLLDAQELIRGFSRTRVYGVELHADAISNLTTGRVIETPTVDGQAFVMFVMAAAGVAGAFYTASLARWRRRVVLLAAIVLYAAIAVITAVNGVLLNVLYDLSVFFAVYFLIRRLQARALKVLPVRESA